MFAIANRMIRDKIKSFAIYSVSAIGFLEMYIVLFPMIKKQSGQFDQLMKAFPPEFFKAMNMDAASFSFSSLQSYLSTEYMSFLWPILAIIFALAIANYIVVNEVDKGTSETLFSLPIKRTKLFLSRYFAGLLLIAVFTALSILTIMPLAMLHRIDFVAANYFTTLGGALLFIWAIYSLAVLFSSIFSDKGRATMASGGVLIVMYFLNIISSLKDSLVNLKYASFFNYFNASSLMAKNTFPEYSVIVLAGFAIIASITALAWFNRRDLSV